MYIKRVEVVNRSLRNSISKIGLSYVFKPILS